jgi:hypothetical protein
MVKLRVDLSGKDAVFLSNANRYYNGLATLDLYRNPGDRVPALPQLKEGLDRYSHGYEFGVNGDRVEIALRKKARADLTEMFKKVLHFLQSVATEDDIPALLQAGIEVVGPSRHRKAAVVPT